MPKTFGTAQTRKGRKREANRRTMNSYSTHNDVTALEFCCCRRKNKKERKKERARRVRQGFAEARLTKRATSLQPTATPQKEHEKAQQKIDKKATLKEGIKPFHRA
jgi:hypothetical protein